MTGLMREYISPLLGWYDADHRDLPWRRTRDPYRIWVSEIMLQQTRVQAVIPYYRRFLEELPDTAHLAACPDDRLMKLWQGLGYYSRVRSMKKAAERIERDFGGTFPGTYEEILSLPGIGSYTAGAVSSIAFGLPEPAVDGNVLRVTARFAADEENILAASCKKRTEAELRALMREFPEGEMCGAFNQALMELGAVVCVPKGEPLCGACPLAVGCEALRRGLTRVLPVREKQKKRKKETLTVLIIRRGDRTAVRRRPDRGLLADLYEYPNCPGSLPAEEVLGYLRGLGFSPAEIAPLPSASHLFTHVEWLMTGYSVRLPDVGTCPEDWVFASPEELREKYAVPSAFSAYTKLLYKGGNR